MAAVLQGIAVARLPPLLRFSIRFAPDFKICGLTREIAERRRLEGIMAKRADSLYASGGRTADWLKVKIGQRQEVVIAGYTAPRRTRPFFGALGTGLSHQTLEELHGKLTRLKVTKSPFPDKVKDEHVTTWVRPSLVAEVKFAEWTKNGELRQPVYLGLRSDKKAKNVVRERPKARR